jgi:hypothetical protein
MLPEINENAPVQKVSGNASDDRQLELRLAQAEARVAQ